MVSFALLSYGVSQVVLVLLTWRDRLFEDSRAEAAVFALSWVAFGAVAVWRGTVVMPLSETLCGLALAGIAVLVVTRGRPVLVMLDGLDLAHVPVQERRRLRRRGRIAQGLVVALIVAGLLWVEL